MAIRRLPDEVIARIAAGEVIPGPCSVLKEVLENALDADATRISVEIGADVLSLTVTDNGKGIAEEDFALLCKAHCTSKISEMSDMSVLSSYGFRGEALSSISRCAKIRVRSRQEGMETGFEATYNNTELVEMHAVGMECGTMMEIKHIFYNNKVREKHFCKKTDEMCEMEQLVTAHSILRLDVHFSVSVGGKQRLGSICVGNTNIQRKMGILRKMYRMNDGLLHVSGDEFLVIFSGSEFVLRKNAFLFFVNGRLVSSRRVRDSLLGVYADVLPPQRRPLLYLELNVPGCDIDVNVHPSKREVLLLHSEQLVEQICSSMRTALRSMSVRPTAYSGRKRPENGGIGGERGGDEELGGGWLMNRDVDPGDRGSEMMIRMVGRQEKDDEFRVGETWIEESVEDGEENARKKYVRKISREENVLEEENEWNHKDKESEGLSSQISSFNYLNSSSGHISPPVSSPSNYSTHFLRYTESLTHLTTAKSPSYAHSPPHSSTPCTTTQHQHPLGTAPGRLRPPVAACRAGKVYSDPSSQSLVECISSGTTRREFRLLSLERLRTEIIDIDTTFIRELGYVGMRDTETILVQHQTSLLSCKKSVILREHLYQSVLEGFGCFDRRSVCIRIDGDIPEIMREMLDDYFSIGIDGNVIEEIPVVGGVCVTNEEKWSVICDCGVLRDGVEEYQVLRGVALWIADVYSTTEMDQKLFNIVKKEMVGTEAVLKCFGLVVTLKELYKTFERC